MAKVMIMANNRFFMILLLFKKIFMYHTDYIFIQYNYDMII